VKLEACMTRKPVCVTSSDTLIMAKALMDAGGFHRVPAVDGGRVVGILTDGDIRKHWGELKSTRVDAAMARNPIGIPAQSSLEDAARMMLLHNIGGLPVVDEGQLVGIVTTTDVLKAFLAISRHSRHG
jgi:acetoin utilization protein AcuB